VFTESGCTYTVGLGVGAQATCTGAVSIPSTLTPGNYFLGAIVDDLSQVAESNENNNTRAIAAAIPIAQPVDLTVTALTAPPTGTIGGSFPAGTVSMTVRNQGTAAAGAFRVGFYFSTDATITTSDVASTTSCNYASGLAAGASNTCGAGVSVQIPATLTTGTYFLGAIADDQAVVIESSETNNARATATTISLAVPPVDLIVTLLTAGSTATVGATNLQHTMTVLNQGSAASGPFRVGYYLSTDATITTGDAFTGWWCNLPNGLIPGTQTSCTGAIGVPATLSPGTYYLGAIADYQAVVAESNESNNTRATTTTIMITNDELAMRGGASSIPTAAPIGAAVTGSEREVVGRTVEATPISVSSKAAP
jgi:subtilase family serine protease